MCRFVFCLLIVNENYVDCDAPNMAGELLNNEPHHEDWDEDEECPRGEPILFSPREEEDLVSEQLVPFPSG